MQGPTRAGASQSRTHQVVRFTAGQYVFRQGDLGAEMYIIHSGRVEILHEEEGASAPVATLERGDFFGEMSLLEELPRMASARAATDVELVLINGSTFDRMLRENPEIAVRIMRKLSRRLRTTDHRLRALDAARTAAPPATATAPATEVFRLVHAASGSEFRLRPGGVNSVGRRDPVTGIEPEVDLTALDAERSSSRRHAKIYREGDAFQLVEDIGTTNGTFVNGTRVQAGVPVTIGPGDVLRFGLVELEFRLA